MLMVMLNLVMGSEAKQLLPQVWLSLAPVPEVSKWVRRYTELWDEL
jgi:hypothetical protein